VIGLYGSAGSQYAMNISTTFFWECFSNIDISSWSEFTSGNIFSEHHRSIEHVQPPNIVADTLLRWLQPDPYNLSSRSQQSSQRKKI
jgi:hypothetical protein